MKIYFYCASFKKFVFILFLNMDFQYAKCTKIININLRLIDHCLKTIFLGRAEN